MPPKRNMDYESMSDSDDDIHQLDGNHTKKSRYQKGSDEYTKRRERNNIAVRKSREKSRAKAKETSEQVNRLRSENEMLEQKVQILSKELSVLKDLFLAHAGTVSQGCGGQVNSDIKGDTSTDHEYSKINSQWLEAQLRLFFKKWTLVEMTLCSSVFNFFDKIQKRLFFISGFL